MRYHNCHASHSRLQKCQCSRQKFLPSPQPVAPVPVHCSGPAKQRKRSTALQEPVLSRLGDSASRNPPSRATKAGFPDLRLRPAHRTLLLFATQRICRENRQWQPDIFLACNRDYVAEVTRVDQLTNGHYGVAIRLLSTLHLEMNTKSSRS